MPARKNKKRLDILLVEKGLVDTRSKAQGMIMAGEVRINGQPVYKPGTRFTEDTEIHLKARPPYVSRGGEKLAGALQDFNFDPANLICADVGASTGGFTDCLLQHNAAKVYAIDVGYGQLAHKLRIDKRVIIIERTNARYVEKLDESVNLVVIDASFISLRILLPVVKNWLTQPGDVIALIKPQFEAGKADVGKGGLVKDKAIHERILRDITNFSLQSGFYFCGLTISPIKGLKSENTEFLIWLNNMNTRPEVLEAETVISTILSRL